VSTELEAELRAAFEAASEPVIPHGDLAGRVRRAVRRRRKQSAAAVAAILILAAASILTGSLLSTRQAATDNRATHHVLVRLGPGQSAEAIEVGGPYLYIATEYSGNPPYALSAYSRSTGRLIGQVKVPATPAAVRTGPGNAVWISFYPDQSAGPCGVWLLTADLTARSSTDLACSRALQPTGPVTALAVHQNGQLDTLTMPPPGRPGRAAMASYAHLGRYAVSALAQVAGYVAALVTNDFGDLHVVTTQRGTSFGGPPGPLVSSIAAGANSLWVTTEPSTGPNAGRLLQLSPALRPITPPAIKANPILRRAGHVWTSENTVWVATTTPGHHLVCFSDRARPGPITTIPLPRQPATLATAGHTAYLTLASPPDGTAAPAVLAYDIPSICR
jgi:hypothetical protein